MSDSFVTPWTVAQQAPLPIEFSRQGYWSEMPFPTLGALPNPGIESMSLASPALAGDSLALHHLGNPIYKYLFTYKYTIIYINKMYNYYVEG